MIIDYTISNSNFVLNDFIILDYIYYLCNNYNTRYLIRLYRKYINFHDKLIDTIEDIQLGLIDLLNKYGGF